MILAVDVGYPGDVAIAAGIGFDAWTDERPCDEHRIRVDGIAPYVPGEFWKREGPPLLALIAAFSRTTTVVVDGYVDLGDRPGLGRHLYEALHGRIPVVGVAKTAFVGARPVEVVRGGSRVPLYVTAAGLDAAWCAEQIRAMHGAHRIPTLLAAVDRMSKLPWVG
jgi:deoxyribonuclease V